MKPISFVAKMAENYLQINYIQNVFPLKFHPMTFSSQDLAKSVWNLWGQCQLKGLIVVLDLENRYEAKNTRMLIDVNTGEDDIVQENGDVVGAEKKKLRRKIDHVQETIDILKKRKIEMKRKNE